MDKSDISGIIINILVNFGCAIVFFYVGIHAGKLDKPMHFWSGSKVDPKTVTDLYAYNQENSRMWKLYSIPYWLGGVFAVLGLWFSWADSLSIVMILLACFIGIPWLVLYYLRIEKKYIRKP